MAETPLTLNNLMERTEGRGVYLVMILLCLPFVQPIPLPGISTVLGLVIALMAVARARDQSPRLPKFIGDRAFPVNFGTKVLGGSIRFLQFLERWVKPRGDAWISTSSAASATTGSFNSPGAMRLARRIVGAG